MSRLSASRVATAFSGVALCAMLPFGTALAGTIVPCAGQCTWSMAIDGQQLASGTYAVDPNSGDILPASTGRIADGAGSWIQVDVSGNADPILGFSVSAGTGSVGSSYSFTFNLPIALSGPIDARSQVSYSLTSLTSAGAQVAATAPSGKIVTALEVDTSVGGLVPLNKGVDVGPLFFFTAGPESRTSTTYTASNSLIGNLAYDLMSVQVAFSLSARSQVGMSGFVEQVETSEVPLPAGIWLLGSSMAGLIGLRRRKRNPEA